MAVVISVFLVVCKIRGRYSDGTSEHEELFECSIQIVYKATVVRRWRISFSSHFTRALASQSKSDFEQASTRVFCKFLERTSSTFVLFEISHYLLPISPTPDPARYTMALAHVHLYHKLGMYNQVQSGLYFRAYLGGCNKVHFILLLNAA
jgi:hypothetical protein